MRRAALLLATLLLPAAAHATEQTFPLDPDHAEVAFRAYALGVVPIDGQFRQFTGTLRTDPEHPSECRVRLTVSVASLVMENRDVQADVLSPELLDASAFPEFSFDGVCRGKALDGTLTLHGHAGRLSLAVTRRGDRYVAQSSLRRADWGVSGRPVLAGPLVRIKVSTTFGQ